MISELIKHQEKLENKELPVKPGQMETLSEAATENDGARQGDLYFVVRSTDGSFNFPENYSEITPGEIDKQLVPGNTKGAKHCLEHLDGVRMALPSSFSRDESYMGPGPIVLFQKENTKVHPEHGAIVFKEGFCVEFGYQKSLNQDEEEIRRLD